MNDDYFLARYFFSNCTLSFYLPDHMVVSRRHSHMGQYDILYSKKITADIDLATRFFDFYDENDRVPSPEELLNL